MAKISCPRCGSHKIVEYDLTFECLNCKSEFKISKSLDLNKEDILSIQEMKGILDGLGLNGDKNRAKELKKILDSEED
jgi:hypothetical protein